MNLTFLDKLNTIANFGVTQVLPQFVKNPDTQAKVIPYVGLGVAAISLFEALFIHHTPPPVVVQTPAQPAAPTA